MIFKCKICGGSLNVKQGEKITICEYCGVKQTIPTFIEPKIEEIYNRANNYLMHNEFDKAENLFNQILFDDNSNADAYWNILMCRYGVSYVKDPASGKYIPTCNRTLYTPIFNDENYKKAIQYADEAQKELYTSDAKIIDDIQKGILSISRKEKPFDIFISYKETNLNGSRTKDSIKAQELYDKLTAEGYKVFFSRITLEDKAGSEYEPYIYAALASSKVMITVCSSKEYIEAVWVKNEWSRFLSFAAKDSEKTLIPLYYDMDKSDLPDDFAHLPSYDMRVDGFEQDLIRGIKKLIPLPIMLLEQRKKRNKILKRIGIGAAACAVVGTICAIPWFMKMPEYNAAMQLYYDKNYAEATWAFDELGAYRDSENMKEQCELSWRKSLATVVTNDSYDIPSKGGDRTYVINSNGTVEDDSGAAYKDLGLNKHGKIVSIGYNTKLYALREDGYVENMPHNEKGMYGEWNDIIQISHAIDEDTIVALNSKGQMCYCDIGWASKMSEWNDIIAFKADLTVIIGLTSRGDLCCVTENMQYYQEFNSILTKFKNVSKFDFSVDLLGDPFEDPSSKQALNIVAITDDNRVISYINGVFEEKEIKNITDVVLSCDLYGGGKINYLDSDGKIINMDTNKYIFEDIVSVNDAFCITRNGSIYSLCYILGSIETDEWKSKAMVYDEWIERLN